MVFHRDQAQFERARWRKALLFPVWLFQIAMLLGLMGVFSYRLAETIENYDENDKKGKIPTVELVWEICNVGLSVVSLVLTIMEIARLLSETLTPWFMLASHVIKMTCAFCILALDIVVYTQRSEGNWSSVGLAIDVGLLLAMLTLGIYSIVTYRRLLEYDDYHHPHNAKAFGFGNGYNEIEMGNSSGALASGDVFLRAGPYNDAPTQYPSQTGRSRSHSAASSRGRLSSTNTLSERPNPLGAAADGSGGRRESYSHERDTQFDDYVARASSAHLSKEDIDRAIGQELWGNAGSSKAAGVERSGSVVHAGTVASQTVQRPHLEHANRTVSWTVEHGLVPVPESAHEEGDRVASIAEEEHGHAHEEEDEDVVAPGHYRTSAAGEDRTLLLGHSRQPSGDHSDDGDGERRPAHEIPGPDQNSSYQGRMT